VFDFTCQPWGLSIAIFHCGMSGCAEQPFDLLHLLSQFVRQVQFVPEPSSFGPGEVMRGLGAIVQVVAQRIAFDLADWRTLKRW